MLYSNILPYSFFFAFAANAQSSSSSSESSSSSDSGISILTGASEPTVPTGSYLSYTSTSTVATSSPISTRAIVSTVTSGSTTRTTTLGSTTILGIGTFVGNSSVTGTETSSTSSQLLLQGATHTSASLNGTNATATSTTSSTPQPTNTTPCNNYPEFCSRKYSNITEVAAHNSPFVKTGNAAANQALPVTTQLDDGIRLLQGQMHFVNSTPHFCHTSCDVLDAGPITDYLGDVYNWVSTHPYDVVTILLGNGQFDNGTYPDVELYTPFLESTGLIQYAYLPPQIPMGQQDWPTLQSMILTGKRVVIFMDYQANQTAVPYVIDEFSNMWETPFDPTNRSFPCTIQRPPALLPKDALSRLYMTNHNLNYDINLLGNSLLVPQIPLLNVTNNVTGEGSLGVGAQTCVDDWNYPPKFLNVDFYNVGNGSVFEVAAKWNNVTYNRSCCGIASTSASSTLEFAGRGALTTAFAVVMFSWMML